MKAVLCKAFGPPESLALEDVAEPVAGPDDVLVERGRIDPLVGRCYPLEQYARALRRLSERRAIGKVVLTVDGDERA